MTSQQDTELEKILIRYRSTADAAWSEVKDGFYTQEEYEVALRKMSDEAIQALTSWKDKEVWKEQERIYDFATRKQANGLYVPLEIGLIPWLEEQLESLQSQGGKK